MQPNDCGSESLPDDWNCEPNHYSLRYVLGSQLYILTCVVLDDSTCLFNLYNATKGTVATISIEMCEVMAQCEGSVGSRLNDIIPKADMLIIRVYQELIVPVAGCINSCGCPCETPDRKPDPCPPPIDECDMKCIQRVCDINYGPPIDVAKSYCQKPSTKSCCSVAKQKCCSRGGLCGGNPASDEQQMACNQSQQPQRRSVSPQPCARNTSYSPGPSAMAQMNNSGPGEQCPPTSYRVNK